MVDYTSYEKIITRVTTVMMVIVAILFVVAIIGAFMFRKTEEHERRSDRIARLIVFVFCILTACGAAGFFFATAYARKYDINNQAYVTYEGEFMVAFVNASQANVFIYTPRRIRLTDLNCDLEEGTYTGRIVYSEKTRIVFEMTVYDEPDVSEKAVSERKNETLRRLPFAKSANGNCFL